MATVFSMTGSTLKTSAADKDSVKTVTSIERAPSFSPPILSSERFHHTLTYESPEAWLDAAVDAFRERVPCQRVSIWQRIGMSAQFEVMHGDVDCIPMPPVSRTIDTLCEGEPTIIRVKSVDRSGACVSNGHVWLVVPVLARGELRGAVTVERAADTDEYTEADVESARTLAGAIGEVWSRKRINELEEGLMLSLARYRLLHEHFPGLVFLLDSECRIVSMSLFAARRLDVAFSDVAGFTFDQLCSSESAVELTQAIRRSQASQSSEPVQYEAYLRGRRGTPLPVVLSIRTHEMPQSDPVTLIAAEDLSRLRKAERQLHRRDCLDPVTGLLNRWEFERQVADGLIQLDGEATCSVIYLNLDHFKVINESTHHEAGDRYLKQIGMVLRDTLGSVPLISRVGADHFAIYLRDKTDAEVKSCMSKVSRAIRSYRFSVDRHIFRCGASVGAVTGFGPELTANDLLARAERACERARQAGEPFLDYWAPHTQSGDGGDSEVDWVARLHDALRYGRFRLFAQPIESLAADRAQHYEILVRMIGQDGEVIPPGKFLPAAERFGLSDELDRWVFHETLAYLQAQHADTDACMYSVNLSGKSLANREFLDEVVATLQRHPTLARRLCFEITESSAIGRFDVASAFIREVHACGAHIALDDFGSGMSSFGYLKKLTVDYLKIDGMFIRDLLGDPSNQAIVKTIVSMAQAFNVKTVAEFVEDRDVAQHLAAMGVDYVQGFGIGKPRPLADRTRHPRG